MRAPGASRFRAWMLALAGLFGLGRRTPAPVVMPQSPFAPAPEPRDSGKSRSYTKKGPGRMPYRRRARVRK
jgi:hypothetical protein